VAPIAPAGPFDWTNAVAYSRLLGIERAGLGWEWLRRRPDFARAALDALERGAGTTAASAAARAFQLHAFEDPRLEALDARPLWCAAAYPWVVPARAVRATPGPDAFELARLARFARIVTSGGTQHVLPADGRRSIRLDVSGAALGDGPVRLTFQLAGIWSLEPPLLVLRRLRSLMLGNRFAPSLDGAGVQARAVLLLRAFDALLAGATHADLAEVLLSSALDRNRWRVHAPSLRSRAQRLARAARRMAAGGFWALLK